MTIKVFHQALSLCEEYDSTPFIGGGEPTLHPHFEKILLECMAVATQIGSSPVGIITNGGMTKRALLIARLTKAGLMEGSLSIDEYHDTISYEVVSSFRRLNGHDHLWDTSKGGSLDPLPHGRAIDLIGWTPEEVDAINDDGSSCVCPSIFVKPNGEIHQCGCAGSPIIGNTKEGFDTPLPDECYRSPWFKSACLESEEDYYDLLAYC